jgi:hypothetical protein
LNALAGIDPNREEGTRITVHELISKAQRLAGMVQEKLDAAERLSFENES